MALSALFDRVTSALFGRQAAGDDAIQPQLVADMIELVVEVVEPRIKFRTRYQDKLEGCMRTTIAHLRSLGREPLEPVLLSRAAWSDDPRVNAFFATKDDVPACLGRSRELRGLFEDPANQTVEEAYALLGMKREERTVLGAQWAGETVKQDVAQVTVSFTGHRLVAISATLEATRLDIGRRIIQRIAQIALSRIVALDMKATELQEHKAYLGARMRLLNLARDGMEGVVKDPATIDEQMAAVQRELKQTVDGYIEAKASLATLDGYIKHIEDVFSQPAQHVALAYVPLRLSRLGVKVDQTFAGPVNEFDLAELSIGENLRAAIAIVRCPRGELPPREDLLANAARYL